MKMAIQKCVDDCRWCQLNFGGRCHLFEILQIYLLSALRDSRGG